MSHPPAQESSGLESTLDAICALGLHQELIEGWANEIKSYTRKARDIATNHIEIKSAVEKTERKLAKRLGRLRSKIEADCIAGVSTNSEDYFFSGAIVSDLSSRVLTIICLHLIGCPLYRRPLRCFSST